MSAREGHLKQDHRLSRNFYKGIKGDNNNVMLAAAAMNFKRMMNKWKLNPLLFLCRFYQTLSWIMKVLNSIALAPAYSKVAF